MNCRHEIPRAHRSGVAHRVRRGALALAVVTLLPSSVRAAQQGSTAEQSAAPWGEETLLLRFPHIHGDRVVFTYAGDLYTAPSVGGDATRLTSHEGMEVFARFSPDGRWIAFSGEYAGTRQVYLIPSAGGEPRQLTFYPDVGPMPPRGGFDHLPLDWTPDGSKILVRANRTPFGQRVGRYFLVDPWNGGLEVPIEIPEGGSGATYDATGTKLAYNIKSREWRHWKRYKGGRQQDVWLYDLASHSSEKVTDWAGTDASPMWVDDHVYYVSDRGPYERLNLWAYDTRSGESRQVTTHDQFDVLWPTRGQGGIVYENGGRIWRLDTASGTSEPLRIRVIGDRPYAIPSWKDASEQVESFGVSPSGNRALFAARGELFTVPAEHGNTRNLSSTPAERERDAAWSPDGRWIAYLSDASGDYDLYVRPADGSAQPRRLARGERVWMSDLTWSPNSERIAFADNRNRLRVVELESGNVVDVDSSDQGGLTDFAWAPDSRWIAYAKTADNTVSSIWIWSAESRSATQVTDDWTDERSPTFDPAGRWLYFVSARDFRFQGAGSGFDSRIYAATLREDLPHPFPPRSDEEPDAAEVDEEAAEQDEADAGQDEEPAPVEIDLEGLGSRVVALEDLNPGSYSRLAAVEDGVLYFSSGTLHRYSMESRASEQIISGINGFALTPNRARLMWSAAGDRYGIVPLQPGQSVNEPMGLSDMRLLVDPRQEWAQIYHDAWVIMRDWFYDPDLHRVEWERIGDLYEPLVEHVAHRADLDFLLAELIAELNVGHAYVNGGGDVPEVERVEVATLGAELVADGERYRFERIFPGENWHGARRSPLTEVGVGVRTGDYLIAIDGEDVTTADNPYRLLVGKAERTVELTVSERRDGTDTRTYTIDPVEGNENALRYQQWVAENAALVDSLSGGRVGYIHLPDTGLPGHRELWEGFRPQHLKDALLIDDRYNGGGNIPEAMSLLMATPPLNYWARRYQNLNPQPGVFHTGPKAMTVNGQSSSGGDALPYYFRELGLGPVIGERTWGGLVGISGNPGFVDGGSISVPTFAFVDVAGSWAVEGEGVTPDIEVLDRPEDIAAGREPILERAVQELLRLLESGERYQRPDVPAGADRGAPGGN
ncbi:MAG TPA: PDZ domain-containing protein [Longimicrobiales bacterium]|nr:PDZ domain-containing protein [Longimicrobiales bacterium]